MLTILDMLLCFIQREVIWMDEYVDVAPYAPYRLLDFLLFGDWIPADLVVRLLIAWFTSDSDWFFEDDDEDESEEEEEEE